MIFVYFGGPEGGGYLRDEILGSSFAGGPQGGTEMVFVVFFDGFGAPFWEPRWPFCRYFRRRFPVLFRGGPGSTFGWILDGFWEVLGVILVTFSTSSDFVFCVAPAVPKPYSG